MRTVETDRRIREWAAREAEGKRLRSEERAARRTLLFALVNAAVAGLAYALARRARMEGERM